MMNEEITTKKAKLMAELNEPLSVYGVTPNDMDTKQLISCKKILDAINQLEAQRKVKKAEYDKLAISMNKVSKTSGLDRKTIERNPIFRTIVNSHLTEEKVIAKDNKLEIEILKLKKAITDHEEQLEASLQVKIDYANLMEKYKELKDENRIMKKQLAKKIEEIKELEFQSHSFKVPLSPTGSKS